MDYLTYGALPESFAFRAGSPEQREYVESVYRTILEKDVLKRNKEGGRMLVGQILKYMADNISSLTSPKKDGRQTQCKRRQGQREHRVLVS